MVRNILPSFCNTDQYYYHDPTSFCSTYYSPWLFSAHITLLLCLCTSFALDTFIPHCLCTSICLGYPSTSSLFLHRLHPRILSFKVTSSRETSPSHIHLPHTTCTLTLLLVCISLLHFSNQKLRIYLHLLYLPKNI